MTTTTKPSTPNTARFHLADAPTQEDVAAAAIVDADGFGAYLATDLLEGWESVPVAERESVPVDSVVEWLGIAAEAMQVAHGLGAGVDVAFAFWTRMGALVGLDRTDPIATLAREVSEAWLGIECRRHAWDLELERRAQLPYDAISEGSR